MHASEGTGLVRNGFARAAAAINWQLEEERFIPSAAFQISTKVGGCHARERQCGDYGDPWILQTSW
jgi:hypothetical protein